MNDATSTIVGLKAQDCPGGGYTVSECLARDGCGCIYGDAVRHIERLTKLNAAMLKHDGDAETVCNSYATENQKFSDEIERLRAIIARYVPASDVDPTEAERERLAIHFEQRQYGPDRYLFPDEIAAEIRNAADGQLTGKDQT